MNRRRLLTAGVASGAVAAGAGWSLWQAADDRPTPIDDGFWSLRFPAPDGGEVEIARFRGRPLVVNFWATWCPPCVKELPELDRFHRDFAARGWQVVGLAIDGPTPVRQFLSKVKIGFSIGLAGFEGTDLSRHLGNDAGSLPFTVVFDRSGAVRHRKLGETSYEQLSDWANSA